MTPATVALPPTVVRALTQIAAKLNDMPRECARDHGALCLWKGGIAREIRAVLTMRVPVAAATSPKAPLTAIPARGAVSVAPEVNRLPSAKKRGVRTIVGRRGRLIRVETRQLELLV